MTKKIDIALDETGVERVRSYKGYSFNEVMNYIVYPAVSRAIDENRVHGEICFKSYTVCTFTIDDDTTYE